MRVLIQRVSYASVTIGGETKSSIDNGLLLFVGIEEEDDENDIEYICKKIVNLRIFDDADGVMNLSVSDVAGELLVVSQFTLHASTRKGNRPSYIRAAKAEKAIPLYDKFCQYLEHLSGKTVLTRAFGAGMQVTLNNNGPVTYWLHTKNRE